MIFSESYIKRLEPRDKTYVVTEDSSERGIGRFQIEITPIGTKTFRFQYFWDKKKESVEYR